MSKRAALRHARNCLRSSEWPARIYPSSIIRVQDRNNPACWLLVLVRHDARLSDLDCLIQDIWPGCCSHHGAFITGIDACNTAGDGTDAALKDILGLNGSFSCRYDSETPTELGLKVLGTTPVMPPEGPLCIIANSPGSGVCTTTENPAAAVRWYPPQCNGEELPSASIAQQGCDEEERSTPADLPEECVNAPDGVNTRTGMIQNRCIEFCSRMDSVTIAEQCRKIVTDLYAHPKDPLSRGDDVLWSAGIVYMACQEEGLIVRTKGGSPLARDICEYYDLKLPSVRSKVTALKKYLA